MLEKINHFIQVHLSTLWAELDRIFQNLMILKLIQHHNQYYNLSLVIRLCIYSENQLIFQLTITLKQEILYFTQKIYIGTNSTNNRFTKNDFLASYSLIKFMLLIQLKIYTLSLYIYILSIRVHVYTSLHAYIFSI